MEHQADPSKPLSHCDYFESKSKKNSDNKGAESQYQEDQNQQLIIEGIFQDKQNCTSVDPTEYEDDEEEENDSKFIFNKMCYSDARMGICSVCQYSIKENDTSAADFGKALLCSNGHLLCHQCVERFAIQSDTNCVLCAATQSQQSISSESQSSSIKRVRPKRKSRLSITHSRRKHQQNDVECYATTAAASCNNIDSHYNMGMNYDRNFVETWNDSERDDTNEELEEELLPHVPKEIKQRYNNINHEIHSRMKGQINSQMMSECSRRPIQCPLLECAVNVAFSALTNHFIFDHPEVPILSVDPGEKSTLIVNFDGLVYNSSQCLALLLLSGKLSGLAAKQFSGNHVHPQYKNRLPLPILAARLHCDASQENSLRISNDSRNDKGDVVIVWVAGLDIGNTTTGALHCSIQAIDNIDNEAFRSLTYTGPINSLRSAQKPREVFLTGDCVILHNGFINQITSGCENLNVNVAIH